MTPRTFMIRCCEEAGIKYDRLLSKDRSNFVVRVRRRIAASFRDDYRMSYPEIGRYLCRDHTSIMYLLGKTAPSRHRGSAKVWGVARGELH